MQQAEVATPPTASDPRPAPSSPAASRRSALELAAPLAVCVAVFLAVAPTLRWLEFCNGMENTVVATVLQGERGHGPWWVPMLNESPRTKKPPLAVWVAASAVQASTVQDLNHTDVSLRDRAYAKLAWEMRWTALAAGCLMLLAVYDLGRTVGGNTLGLLSMLACGTSLHFLRHTRYATTDIHLALWVAVGNAFLARALLARQYRLGFVGAGLALGLAMMSKGPVALVQSVVPAAAFAAWRWRAARPPKAGAEAGGFPVIVGPTDRPADAAGNEGVGTDGPAAAPLPPLAGRAAGGWAVPLLTGVALFASVGLPWFVSVALKTPNIGGTWKEELNATDQERGSFEQWYAYIVLVPFLFPWAVYFIAGLVGAGAGLRPRAARTAARGPLGRAVLVFCMVVVPVLVMSLFRNRKERYLLPMIGPACVLAAWALAHHLGPSARRSGAGRALAGLHWAILAAVAVGLPLAGMSTRALRTVNNFPWYSPRLAVPAAVAAVVVLGAGLLVDRRRRLALPVATAAVMLPLQALYMAGYRDSPDARSDMKPLAELIRTLPPGTHVYSYRPGTEARHAPQDLAIYLNHLVERVRDPNDPAELPPPKGPEVLVVCQRKRQPLTDLPGGWRPVPGGQVPSGPNLWNLYVRGP